MGKDTTTAGKLQKGDLVQVAGGSFEPVVGFLHRDDKMASLEFVEVDGELFSADHRVFLADGTTVASRDLRVGDKLAGGIIVQNVANVVAQNSYVAPLT